MKNIVRICLVLFLALPVWAKPPVFSDLSWEQAQNRADSMEKLLIVDFSATWCVPCRVMDKTTWREDSVETWMEQRTVSIQLDWDEYQDLADQLKVVSVPTVLVFKGGQEIDRSSGMKSGEELIEWLSVVEQGGTALTLLRSKVAQDPEDLGLLYDMADVLLEKGEYQEAMDIYLRLWEDMRGTDFSGVRNSYLIDSMSRASEQSPYAASKLATIVDELSEKVEKGSATSEEIVDWIAWKKKGKEVEDVLAWFSALHDPKAELYDAARPNLFRIMTLEGEMTQAGFVFPEPVLWAKQQIETWEELAEEDESFQKYAKKQAKKELGLLYQCLLGVDRKEEASELKELVFSHFEDPSVREAFE